MLVIRREQIDALAVPVRRRFSLTLAKRLKDDYPNQTKSIANEALLALVDDAFALGARHGIESFGGVEICARLLVTRGPAFDDAQDPPALREILSNADIPGDAKAHWLEQNLLVSP